MPLFGPPDVPKLGAKGDVPGLIKALSYKGDSRVRWSSATALGTIADRRAVEPLIVALGDSDKDVRSTAALALSKIGDRRAVEPLIATLGDRERDVRIAGAQSLGRIGDPRSIGPLTTAVDQDPHDWVRLAAGQALEDMGVSGMLGRAQSRRLLAELRAEGGAAEPVRTTKRSHSGRRPRATTGVGEITATAPSYRLVPVLFDVGVAFACEHCSRPLTIKLDDLDGPFTCRQCGSRIAVPVISCHYQPSCSGTYEKCGGPVLQLVGEELDRERAAASEGQSEPTGRPTDDDHDEWRDVEHSILSHKCSRCERKFTRAIVDRLYRDHGARTCDRATCGRCLRVPTRDELMARG